MRKIKILKVIKFGMKRIFRSNFIHKILEGEVDLPLPARNRVNIERLTCKEFYNILLSKLNENPTSEITIQNILNSNDINWRKAYTLAREVTIDNYSRNFISKQHIICFI